jgi:hypothetical protein
MKTPVIELPAVVTRAEWLADSEALRGFIAGSRSKA